MERWLPVVGYEELYEVSDLGRIRRLPGPASDGSWRKGGLLKPARGTKISLADKRGKIKQCYLSRLVLEAFKGLAPSDKPIARHLDDNRFNNNLDNLEWGTTKDNTDDAFRNGRMGHLQNPVSPETRLKKSLALKGRPGTPWTDEHREKYHQTTAGRVMPDWWRKKISEANMGHEVSQETRNKISRTKRERYGKKDV